MFPGTSDLVNTLYPKVVQRGSRNWSNELVFELMKVP
jgi:hypothetical protein